MKQIGYEGEYFNAGLLAIKAPSPGLFVPFPEPFILDSNSSRMMSYLGGIQVILQTFLSQSLNNFLHLTWLDNLSGKFHYTNTRLIEVPKV